MWDVYFKLVREHGDEFTVLADVPVADLARTATERVALGIDRMRQGRVKIEPGYDGEYGVISLYGEEPAGEPAAAQLTLF